MASQFDIANEQRDAVARAQRVTQAAAWDFGGADQIRQVAASDGDGSTFAVPAGTWLICVKVEEVEVKRDATTIAADAGTPLVVGTQVVQVVSAAENWAVRSAGGAGVIVLTKALES